MHDAFVSYARVDREIADRVCVGLSALSWNVWWDDALTAGETFADVISAKLGDVGSVIVLWTAGATASEWVLAEAAVGRDRGVLIPVQLEKITLPSGFDQIHTLTGNTGLIAHGFNGLHTRGMETDKYTTQLHVDLKETMAPRRRSGAITDEIAGG